MTKKKKSNNRGIEFVYTKKPNWWDVCSVTIDLPRSVVYDKVWIDELGHYHATLNTIGNTSQHE